MSEKITARELNTMGYEIQHGSYEHMKLRPQTNAGVLFKVASSGNETIFEIPPKVFNLSETILYYTLHFKTVNGVNKIGVHYVDTVPEIKAIYLYNSSNIMLCEIDDVNYYVNATLRHKTKWEVCNTNSKPVCPGLDTLNASTTNRHYEGLFLPSSIVTNPLAALNVQELKFKNVNIPALTGDECIDNLTTPCYAISTDTAAGSERYLVIKKRLRLGDIYKDTIFDYNKDLYFGETIYLKIIYAVPDHIGYQADSTVAYATPASFHAEGYNIHGDLSLYLAEEKNPIIQDLMRKKFEAGYIMHLPNVYVNNISLAASTSHTVIVRYTPDKGKYLKSVTWVPYHPGATIDTTYDHNNRDADVILNFYVTINGNRTTPFNLDCTKGEDYMKVSRRLKGSCITSMGDYYDNFQYTEYFTDNYSLADSEMLTYNDNKIDGLPMDKEIIIQFDAQTGNLGFKHMVFANVIKDLYVGKDGIRWI